MSTEDLPVDDEVLEIEPDEVGEVLQTLKGLLDRVSSPVVRACLEDAHDDIVHLTGRDQAAA